MDHTVDPPDLGVYVHVPFCARRRDYCALAIWTDCSQLVPAYVRACIAEVRAAALAPASSVFSVEASPRSCLRSQLAAVGAAVDRRAGAEVTVE